MKPRLDDERLEGFLPDYEKYARSAGWPGGMTGGVDRWKATATFRENWDGDATDFPGMLEKALSGSGGLFFSRRVSPADRLVRCAKARPEEVRRMFADLFDESKDAAARVTGFCRAADMVYFGICGSDPAAAEAFRKEGEGLYYASLQTCLVASRYLWLRYPDRHYPYEKATADALASALRYDCRWGNRAGELPEGYGKWTDLMESVRAVVSRDGRLVGEVSSRLGEDGLDEAGTRVLALDVADFIARNEGYGHDEDRSNAARDTGDGTERVETDDGRTTLVLAMGEGGYAVVSARTSCLRPEIPSSHDGVPVTRIGDRAFRGLAREIELPPSVTDIGERAFSGCPFLEEVAMPGAKKLDAGAFGDCVSLRRASVPGTVGEISPRAFFGCSSLESLSIGDGVRTIGERAFYGCVRLKRLRIPSSVTAIGELAFAACRSLSAVELGAGLKYTGEDAFRGCGTVAEVSNLSSLPLSAGSDGCGGLGAHALYVRTAEGESRLSETDDGFLFYSDGRESLLLGRAGAGEKNLVLPESFRGAGYSVRADAFRGDGDVWGVSVPPSVKGIGDRAFLGCANLLDVSLSDGPAYVGREAFSGCGVKSVVLPPSVVSVGERAFEDCRNLEELEIGAGVAEIGEGAFDGCDSLRKVRNLSSLDVRPGRGGAAL